MHEDIYNEISALDEMLTLAGIPHTFMPLFDGFQIRLYADAELTRELDDCILHSHSHGWSMGLLETFRLGGCDGWESAEEVFEGWKKMYDSANA